MKKGLAILFSVLPLIVFVACPAPGRNGQK